MAKMAGEMNEDGKVAVDFIAVNKADHLYNNTISTLEREIENYINIKIATRVAKPVKKKRRKRKKKDSIF